MTTTFKNTLRALLLVPVLALGVSAVTPATDAYAKGTAVNCTNVTSGEDLSLSNGVDCAKGKDQSSDLFGPTGVFSIITNVLIFIIGAVSVIMLIIGGIRYTVSGGDSTAVTGAKNTILYSIVGLVVAILAYAAVNFVVGSFAG